jgi:WD40 repeat protein
MNKIEVFKKFTLTGHRDCIYTLKKAGKNNVFFSGAGDGMVVQWDLNNPDQGELMARVPASVYAIDYCPFKNLLVVGQNYEGIQLINVSSKKLIGSLKLTPAAIFDIKILDDKIYIGTGAGELIVVKIEPLSILYKIKHTDKSLRSIAIDPLNRQLLAGYSDHNIRIFNLDDHSQYKLINAHKNSVFTMCFSPDYKYLLTAGRDAHLKIWNTNNDYNLQESIVAHMYAINHVEYSPDGKHFVTCSMDKSIKVWDSKSFKLLKVIDIARHAGHGTSVNKLLWSTYEDFLISCSDDRTISVWDLKF